MSSQRSKHSHGKATMARRRQNLNFKWALELLTEVEMGWSCRFFFTCTTHSSQQRHYIFANEFKCKFISARRSSEPFHQSTSVTELQTNTIQEFSTRQCVECWEHANPEKPVYGLEWHGIRIPEDILGTAIKKRAQAKSYHISQQTLAFCEMTLHFGYIINSLWGEYVLHLIAHRSKSNKEEEIVIASLHQGEHCDRVRCEEKKYIAKNKFSCCSAPYFSSLVCVSSLSCDFFFLLAALRVSCVAKKNVRDYHKV